MCSLFGALSTAPPKIPHPPSQGLDNTANGLALGRTQGSQEGKCENESESEIERKGGLKNRSDNKMEHTVRRGRICHGD